MRAPSCAKASAVARPIPVSAPVIKTTGVVISVLPKVHVHLPNSTFNLVSRHRIGYDRQGCFRTLFVNLRRRRPAQPDRPDNFSVHLDGKASAPRCHTSKI